MHQEATPSVSPEAFAIITAEVRPGDDVPHSVAWMHRRDPVPGEFIATGKATLAQVVFRNRIEPWPGTHISGYWDGDKGLVRCRDHASRPGSVIVFIDQVCQALGARIACFDASPHNGFTLYDAQLVSAPEVE